MKRKINYLKFFVIALTVFCALQFTIFGITPVNAEGWASSLTASFGGLSTNSAGQYVIYDADDLVSFSKAVNNGTATKNKVFVVIAEIDMNDATNTYTTAGTSSNPFKGTFKGISNSSSTGNSVAIKNLTCSLFGYIQGATISNIELIDGSNSDSKQFLGGIVDKATGSSTIKQCRNGNTVTNSYSTNNKIVYTGGIVGYSEKTTISECTTTASVKNTSSEVTESYVGGIVGYATGGSINNCYTIGLNGTISVSATAKVTITNSTIMAKGKSVHYSIVSSYSDKAKAELNEAKAWLKKKQDEFNSKQKEGQGIQKDINNMNAKLNTAKSNLKKCKWYEFGKIAKYAAQVTAYGIALGALYTAQATVNAALWVAQQAMELAKLAVEGAEIAAAQLLYDSQWVNNYKDSTKKVETKKAYAYGIGYSDKQVTNSYTAKINVSGGYENVFYEYHLQYWAEMTINWNFYGSSEKIDREVTYKNDDKFGRISNNANNNNCFYYETEDSYTREIYLDYTGNYNWYNQTKSTNISCGTLGKIGKQKMIFDKSSKSNNKIKLSVANAQGNAKTKVYETDFNTALQTYYGKTCNKNLSTLKGKVGSGSSTKLNNTIWAVDDAIESGFPHLQYKYWQDQV
ncbi:MAG: hypothetical protein E7376_04835 [Clostridiales bacterium]|nr:hypothetical protein [Clostridiales bacterium]